MCCDDLIVEVVGVIAQLSVVFFLFFFFFKQKTAYEIGTGDWSSDVCSSDLFYNTCISCMQCKCNESSAGSLEDIQSRDESFKL